MESEVYQLILGDRVSFANLQAVYLKDTQNMPDVPQKIIGETGAICYRGYMLQC